MSSDDERDLTDEEGPTSSSSSSSSNSAADKEEIDEALQMKQAYLHSEIVRLYTELLSVPPEVWINKDDIKSGHIGLMNQCMALVQMGKLLDVVQKQLKIIEKCLKMTATWPTKPLDLMEEFKASVLQQRKEFRLERQELYGLAAKALKKRKEFDDNDDDDAVSSDEDDESSRPLPAEIAELCGRDADTVFLPPLNSDVDAETAATASDDPCLDRITPAEYLPRLSDDPKRSYRNKGHVNLCPRYDEATVRRWLASPPARLTFFKDCCLRAVLKNPLPLSNGHQGYVCDLCNRYEVRVAYQVAQDDDTRDTTHFYKNSIGMDICVACAVYFFQSDEEDMQRFYAAPCAVAASDAATSPSSSAVAVAAVDSAFRQQIPHACLSRRLASHCLVAITKAPCCQPELSGGGGKKRVVQVSFGIAPRGAHAVAWVGTEGAPACPPNWRDRCAIQYAKAHRHATSGEGEPDNALHSHLLGSCAICIDDMALEEGNCVQTRCGHWFHSGCIKRVQLAAKNDPAVPEMLCPLCREKEPLKDDDPASVVVTSNVYDVAVTLPDQKEGGGRQFDYLFVGSLVSADGAYLHSSDLGACLKLSLAELGVLVD